MFMYQAYKRPKPLPSTEFAPNRCESSLGHDVSIATLTIAQFDVDQKIWPPHYPPYMVKVRTAIEKYQIWDSHPICFWPGFFMRLT